MAWDDPIDETDNEDEDQQNQGGFNPSGGNAPGPTSGSVEATDRGVPEFGGFNPVGETLYGGVPRGIGMPGIGAGGGTQTPGWGGIDLSPLAQTVGQRFNAPRADRDLGAAMAREPGGRLGGSTITGGPLRGERIGGGGADAIGKIGQASGPLNSITDIDQTLWNAAQRSMRGMEAVPGYVPQDRAQQYRDWRAAGGSGRPGDFNQHVQAIGGPNLGLKGGAPFSREEMLQAQAKAWRAAGGTGAAPDFAQHLSNIGMTNGQVYGHQESIARGLNPADRYRP